MANPLQPGLEVEGDGLGCVFPWCLETTHLVLSKCAVRFGPIQVD